VLGAVTARQAATYPEHRRIWPLHTRGEIILCAKGMFVELSKAIGRTNCRAKQHLSKVIIQMRCLVDNQPIWWISIVPDYVIPNQLMKVFSARLT